MSSLRLINAKELEDLFEYGIDDLAVLGDQALDAKVQEIIMNQPTISAVPYYKIAQTIIKVREMHEGLDYVNKKDVIDLLWRLIDKRPDVDEIAEDKT